MKIKRKLASIIIIGNEILSGKTLDTNSNYVAKKLHSKRIKCTEITVIADEESLIIKKINEARKKMILYSQLVVLDQLMMILLLYQYLKL